MTYALVLHNVHTDRYHAALFTEAPMPGGKQPPHAVRLWSRAHHTEGADTFNAALLHLADLGNKVGIPDTNIVRDHAEDWDGEPGIVMFLGKR